MDLVSSLRKEGTSRGGVNFSWDQLATSEHRQNYLGHSLMAPQGRWQKGKDLSWYAKGDDTNAVAGETEDERKSRERKEEIRKIKEAEEDALARALGLPVPVRNTSGANSTDLGEVRRIVNQTGEEEEKTEEDDRDADVRRKFGDYVGNSGLQDELVTGDENPKVGGLIRAEGSKARADESRSREKRHRRHHRRDGSRGDEGHRERTRRRSRSAGRRERRHRSRSPDRRDRKHRSRSGDRRREEREERSHRYRDTRPRKSRSPEARERRRGRDHDERR